MLSNHNWPILEFDDNKWAKINPDHLAGTQLSGNKLVITFFPEIIDMLVSEKRIVIEHTIPGENPIYIYRFVDDNVLITLGHVGCPACGSNLDLFNAMGVDKVMFCGGGGVLDSEIRVGQLLLVDGAIRDEGFSYHYIPPARCVYANTSINERIAQYLESKSVAFTHGLVWTTDAIFRETNDRIARRKAEGARIVEMEQAGCLAVAQVRGFDYGAIIYGGDDVSQNEWDQRSWRSRKGIRYDLVLLCKDLTKII